MKKDWNKACKLLTKAAGLHVSMLKAEQWPTGMDLPDHTELRFLAYIDIVGHSDPKKTAMEAVIDIIDKMKNKC